MRITFNTKSYHNSYKPAKFEPKINFDIIQKDFVSFGSKQNLASDFLLQLRQIDFNKVKFNEKTPKDLTINLDKTEYIVKKSRYSKHFLFKQSELIKKEKQELSPSEFEELKNGLKGFIVSKILQKHGFKLMSGKENSRLFAPAQDLVEFSIEDMFRALAHGLLNNKITKVSLKSHPDANIFKLSDNELLTVDTKTKKIMLFNSETYNTDSIGIGTPNELRTAENFTLLSRQMKISNGSKKEAFMNKTLEELFK